MAMMTSLDSRLNQIATRWTLVNQACVGGTMAVSARNELLDRYCGAAWRYLHALARNESIAEDLFQEFALRLIRGDFRRAESQRGRFRDYLKAVLINLVKDHFRRSQRSPLPLPADLADPSAPFDAEPGDAFLDSWRDELLQRVWTVLEERHEVLHAVLRVHAAHPEASAGEKAELLSRRTGEASTPNHFRVMLHRARRKFAMLLRQEVAVTLGDPSEEELQAELRQLRLLRYCTDSAVSGERAGC
jgi:RNA polymerase sigma-70 factor (ECF subfamily)